MPRWLAALLPAGSTGLAADPVGPLDLGLSDEELRDLYLIVELSQDGVPARFERETADGRVVFQLSLSHSSAFGQRLRSVWASRGGLGDSRAKRNSRDSEPAAPPRWKSTTSSPPSRPS